MRPVRIFLTLLLVSSCGGGGGGGGSTPTPPSVPAPTVSFSANPTSVVVGSDSTLTWSSTNASSCSTSGAWSGSRATSGSETVTISAVGNISFTITCSGEGGNRSATVTVEGYRQTDGVVVDGYISGADVFIDENANYVADATENATTSDNEGKFTIKYADGSLISLGGTDLDSQTLLDNLLITHKMTGHSDFKAITPVTSVAAFMQDASSVNAALGIDAAIDVFTFDPVANKGDGGINDYLYEKGNQLTVLAFALQNIVNDLNATTETTQDYFKAIAEEVDTEFANTATKVDIETETFITNVINNILTAKSITMDESIKANTISALAGVLPIIQVQSTDDLTTAVIRFSLSTLQTDIVGVANGTATEELITSYTSDILNYIAEDQNIDSDDITPNITAIADTATVEEDGSVTINVVANDSYTTAAPIGVSAGNGTNGSTTLAESSPEQVVYTPNADFNGTDTFTYTITQGDKTSSAEVTVTVSAVNDAPSIDIASTIQVPENQTSVTTVSVSDVDEDELTLNLDGTDAASFNLSSENVLTFKEAPDYETKTSYGITLSLTDGTETVTKSVTIAITNVNDNYPEIQTAFFSNFEENQTEIGQLEASDADNDELTYEILASDFTISSTGIVNSNINPDCEMTDNDGSTISWIYEFYRIFRVSDGENYTDKKVFFNIICINDNAPIIESPIRYNVLENQTTISPSSVNASDIDRGNPDGPDQLIFSITGSEVSIDESYGTLTLLEAADYEAKTQYSATVTVSDGKFSTSEDIEIYVSNENDNSPVITSDSIFNIDENQTTVGDVEASDADGDDLNYRISANSGMEISSEGVLTFLNPPDYESTPKIYATVIVDDGINETRQDITISLNNLNDNSPVINKESPFTFRENSSDMITQIAAIDADNNTLTYSLSGADASSLEIDSSMNGELRFKEAPDYEEKSSYSITVNVSDSVNTASKDFQINITNLNDNLPEITSSSIFSALENQTDIGTVEASDADGESLTIFDFKISQTNDITINASTGVLSFVTVPDYETQQTYTARVSVGDGTSIEWDGNSRPNGGYVSQDITVNITNQNDYSPEFTSDPNFNIDENQTLVGTVEASDQDNDSVTFSVSGSDLAITSAGILSFISAPDYESKSSFSATVTASDGSNTTDQNILVSVNNVNDNSPAFKSSSSFSVNENQNAIGTVSAIDADGDTVSFSIDNSDININASTGVMTFVSMPDYETQSSYVATISASDGENSIEQDISISIIDLNEFAPVFGNTSFEVSEQEIEIGNINVSDADGDNLSLTLSGGDANAFVINSAFRTINFISPPIYEDKDRYETTVSAFDGSFSSSQKLIVNISELSYLPTHPQAITGTDTDNTLEGNDGEYNILIGGKGDDILTGGQAERSNGGYSTDIFQFTNNSGNDIITDFFIQDLWQPEGRCAIYNSSDGRCRSDRLEITSNINNTGISTAHEILENSQNNAAGNAVINLGQGNTITLEGVSIDEITPEHIHIIPIKLNVVQGEGTFSYESPSDQDDILQPLQFNTRMEGSKDPFGRTDDGYDILNSGLGDDVLIGGTNDNNQGDAIDLYKFYEDNGNDLIIGYFDAEFARELDGTYTTIQQGSGRKSDKIIIPININETSIDSFEDIKLRSSNNLDGWAKLDLGSSNYVTVHGVPIEKLTSDSFIFTYSENYNEIYAEEINTLWSQKNSFIQGTSNNDWISGPKRFLPWRGNGIDYIFPGSGNDILISGIPGGAAGPTVYETFYMTNFFINEPGKKTIIGFSARGSEIFNPYTKNMLDRIFIPSNGSNNFLSDLSISYDDDGFLTLLIDSETEVKLHSIDQGEIDLSNIIVHQPFDNYEYGTLDNDYLVGTSGNDYIDGWGEYKIAPPTCSGIASGSDILVGNQGDDILVGGVSFHWCGGFNRDTFKFSNNSGNDTIVDFTSNFELPGYVNFYLHMDVLEIEENINGISFKTAQELLDISSNNVDGFAQIQLGSSNSITLHDKSISTISPMHFRIIPKIDSYIVGTEGDDVLIGDDFNNYIKGSNATLNRYSDGYDTLDGGAGDDVLDGGNYKRSRGGYVTDIYKFDENYGFDRIFNFFSSDIAESYGGGTYSNYEAGVRGDKIMIPNDVVSSARSIIDSSSNNADGFAHLQFSGTEIVIHMLSKEQLKPEYFYITPRTSNNIIGTPDNDYLIGTNSNDKIQGTINPFAIEDNGSDFIEGGEGDDILIGGPAERSNGGYASDKYRFNDNFGHDYLISFFAEDISPGYSKYSNPDGEGAAELSDKLEFNNIFGSTATDLINKASDNEDGWAVITLGANSLTIYGISSEDLKPDYFYIIPTIENTIIGTNNKNEGEESHIGTSGNDYIQASNNSLFSHYDGPDILNGKEGDDVLIGGPNERSNGGFEIDTYIFEANSGNDLIIGFLFDGTGSSNEYNDIIQIPIDVNGSGISSFNDILNATSDNKDGWAVIDLGLGNTITLHGVSKSELLQRNFIIR